MNHNTLIGVIVTVLVAVGVVAITRGMFDDLTGTAEYRQDRIEEGWVQELSVVNVMGTNITKDGIKYVRIQVRNDGAGALDLNDTLIQLRTTKTIADLTYRNGTLEPSEAEGFYTKDAPTS